MTSQSSKATWIYFTSTQTKKDTLTLLRKYADKIMMYSSQGQDTGLEFKGVAKQRTRGTRWTDLDAKMEIIRLKRNEVDFKITEVESMKTIYPNSFYDSMHHHHQGEIIDLSSISKPSSSPTTRFLSGSGSDFKTSASKDDNIFLSQLKSTQPDDDDEILSRANVSMVVPDPFPEHNTAADIHTKNSPLWISMLQKLHQSEKLRLEGENELTRLRAEICSLKAENSRLSRKSSPPLMMRWPHHPTEPTITTMKSTEVNSEDDHTPMLFKHHEFTSLEENSNSRPFDDPERLKYLCSSTEYK